MKISQNGIELIKEFEGLSLTPYLCSAGVPTIGFGNTYYLDERKVSLSDKPLSKEQADELLLNTVEQFENGVNKLVKVPLNQNQFDALVSFTYNIGLQAFSSSTLLKKLNAGDYKGAANEFLRWNKAGGKVLGGLTRRREIERKMFLS